ncbi:MAG TPA: hypothetical protein VEK79_01355 [Thermoanaerobaculia bacterium]|nr:hypothetical protein [Thermoanaerobaculia bacterium]
MTRLLILSLVVAAMPMFAQTHDWTSVGNSGRVTQPSAFKVAWVGPTLRFSSISTGDIVARYPVTNTYGSGTSKTPPWTTLWSTFKDNSASGSVTTRLYEVDKCSAAETLICTITSSDSASNQCSSCTFGSSTFDFANNTYWVEVTLSRTATSAAEEIHSLAIN